MTLSLNQDLEFGKLLQDGRLLVPFEDLRRVFCEGSSGSICVSGLEEDQIFGLLTGHVLLEGIVTPCFHRPVQGLDIFIRDLNVGTPAF